MIFILQQDITKKQAIYITKFLRIKKYSGLNKNDLIHLINLHFAQKYCMKIYRKYKTPKQYINDIDPLSLTSIKQPFFEVEISRNKFYRYNMISFYSYMVKTGKFSDPYTDIEFTDNQLQIMDKQLSNAGYMKTSLFSIKNNPNKQKYYKRQHEKVDYLLGMDRQLGELVSEICDNLSHQNHNTNENLGYYNIVDVFIPNFIYLIEQIKRLDIEYTRNCIKDYISWVKKQNVPLGNIITNMLSNELQHIS